jgi:predicted RNase H-related nuclease YkuK (DUF458 family)
MTKYFRKKDGELVNIVEHTLEQIQQNPNVKIYIGTDSQDEGPCSEYATCIVYRYGRNGAHFIYSRESVPRIWDMFTRLYTEGTRTIEVAELIRAEILSINFEALEFDYADVKKTLSTRVVSALRGWVKGMGLNASFKGGEKIATKSADHVCRHKEMYK